MRPCIECGTPTEGSIGAAGLKWSMLCQPCKDKADQDLHRSIAAMTAAIDYALPRTLEVFRGGQAALLDPQTKPDDGPHPSTCILTGASGEDPDDCTTHEHENAGCDKCGMHDREPGSLWCSGCNEEWNRLQAEPSPTTPEAA